MLSRINWRYVLIVFLAVVGVNGIIEALPKTRETTRDLLIDGAILLAIIGISVVFARLHFRRLKAKAQGAPGRR